MTSRTCISCLETKGYTGFSAGKLKCRKCSKVFAGQKTYKQIVKGGSVYSAHTQPQPVGPLPQIGAPEPEDKVKQFWAVQKARLARSEKVYQEYIAAHPTEFKDGDHIIIVDNQTTLHRFDNDEAATKAARVLAPDGGYYHTEYGREKRVILIYNVINGTFKSGAKNALGYVKANVKNTDESTEEYKIEMIVDTGAGGCVISEQLAIEMGAQMRESISVGTAGLSATGYLIKILYQLEDWQYKEDIETIVIPGGQSNLLGMSYLRLCHQTWIGDQSLKLKLLEDNELPDVDMTPGLLSRMEQLTLNLHQTESTAEEQKNRIELLESSLRNALEENGLLEMMLKDMKAEIKGLKRGKK
jgi:predicted aspartyl protease